MKNKRQNVELFNELHGTAAAAAAAAEREMEKMLRDDGRRAAYQHNNTTYTVYIYIAIHGRDSEWWHRIPTILPKRTTALASILKTLIKHKKICPLPKIIWNVLWLFNKLYSIHKSSWIVVIIVRTHVCRWMSPPSAAVCRHSVSVRMLATISAVDATVLRGDGR